ncbi:hypothetical protein TWF506_003243 [Arthrobotrys conoides]|uniref:Uncharacterized protein n=1 Tax=Arthrobotrys conoides TaxID=74498 RepID=A0AAN8RUH4_9PEZI
MAQSRLNLVNVIQNGEFYTLPTDECLQLIKEEYPIELEWLKTAYAVPGPTSDLPETPSPSMHLYGAEFDEVNRTLVSVLSLRWIYNKDYNSFIRNQIPHIKLTSGSFDWISTFFHNSLNNTSSDDVYSLITSIIINDLGKSQSLITEYQRLASIDISRLNHDMILYQVVSKYPHLIPSLSRLPETHKADLIMGIKLGAEFSFGQLAQAENVPASLLGIEAIKGHTHAFDLRFMEQLLDIAGAAGHVDHTCAKKLTEPVFQSFKNVYDASIGIIEDRFGVDEAYSLNLTRRVELLINVGWEKGRELDVDEPIHRALMRLLCMTNSADVEAADLIFDTFFKDLSDDTRFRLIIGLNSDGSLKQPAVQATYIPAVCSAAINSTKVATKSEKEKALAAVFRYLARTLDIDVEEVQKRLPPGVLVIERDIRRTIMDIVNSKHFREDPGILDCIDVPKDDVAKMAEGYEWVIQ